jgi:endonuclease/exonuclease/phosphatase family metal-dependent hydrolase
MRISQITRRDIVDAILVEQINWSDRMEEATGHAREKASDHAPVWIALAD